MAAATTFVGDAVVVPIVVGVLVVVVVVVVAAGVVVVLVVLILILSSAGGDVIPGTGSSLDCWVLFCFFAICAWWGNGDEDGEGEATSMAAALEGG